MTYAKRDKCEVVNGDCISYDGGKSYIEKCYPNFTDGGKCCSCNFYVNCPSLGYAKGTTGTSCQKKVIIGTPSAPTVCPSTYDLDGGICYPQCAKGFTRISSICVQNPPSNMVSCGMAAGIK